MQNEGGEETGTTRLRALWRRLGTPIKVGVLFAFIAGLMALVGWVVRPEYTSRSLISLFLAVSISAATWGVVSWAIAAAAVEATREEE
jgi:hypothetical protein